MVESGHFTAVPKGYSLAGRFEASDFYPLSATLFLLDAFALVRVMFYYAHMTDADKLTTVSPDDLADAV